MSYLPPRWHTTCAQWNRCGSRRAGSDVQSLVPTRSCTLDTLPFRLTWLCYVRDKTRTNSCLSWIVQICKNKICPICISYLFRLCIVMILCTVDVTDNMRWVLTMLTSFILLGMMLFMVYRMRQKRMAYLRYSKLRLNHSSCDQAKWWVWCRGIFRE